MIFAENLLGGLIIPRLQAQDGGWSLCRGQNPFWDGQIKVVVPI